MFLGDVDDAGNRMAHCAIETGAGENTEIHCVGDGAPWIAGQVERVFRLQASYLIDFYHLCEYLVSATDRIVPEDDKKAWLADQKEKLKEGKITEVIEVLKPHLEPQTIPREQAPVRAYRYMVNRQSQFDYKGALARDLPIGSGTIESAHRHVIQDRLKLAGAWWTAENARNMLALRTLRANNQWESYWELFRTLPES